MASKRDRKDFVKSIIKDFRETRGIFTQKGDLLEYQIPADVVYGSKEHALFYFFLIYNDHGTKSTRLYQNFKDMFVRNKALFDPLKVVEMQDELLHEIENLGVRYKNNSHKYWLYNAQKLCDEFDGDVMQMICSYNDAMQLYKKIREFKGYGEKTTGLLLRVIEGVSFNKELKNFKDVPLPVDTHDTKIAINCGFVEYFEYEKADKSKLKEVSSMWQKLSSEVGVSWDELDKALWILGSVGCVKKLCGECPVHNFCKVGMDEINLFSNTSLQS